MSTLFDLLLSRLDRERAAVLEHPVYAAVSDRRSLATFMEHHVFAVWDFMSLLKTLQRGLTCVDVPWLPPRHPAAARLVNEMVLAEESDRLAQGDVRSHFQLYRDAMLEVGASTRAIDAFLSAVREGETIERALLRAEAPQGARAFVAHTMLTVETRRIEGVAASFLLGREDLVPAMFRRLLPHLPAADTGSLRLYLARHIEVDEGEHGPAARELLLTLCKDDELAWVEAQQAARAALVARRALWTSTAEEIGRRATPLARRAEAT